MKILVLGGTGAIGSFLVECLSRNNYNVFVTTRNNRKSSNTINYIIGNAHDTNFFNTLLKNKKWDCIIDFMNYTTEEFKNRYIKLLESTKQYIFISSSRIYADSISKIVEDSPILLETSKDRVFLKSDDYALAKARQEKLLKNSNYYNYTIIRPYMSYFPYRLDLGFYPKEIWLHRVLNNKTIIFPKNLLDKYTTLTYGQDVAKGIFSIIGKDESLGNTFHITQNTSCTWAQVIKIYSEALKQKNINLRIKYIDKDKCYGYINVYDRLFNRSFNNNKINNFLSTSDFKDPKFGIVECINSFLSSPKFSNIDWKIYAHHDRLSNEFTSLSCIPTIKSKFLYIVFRYIISFTFLKQLKKHF